MKIALLGYGKMGKTIEQIAIAHGHEIVLKIDNAETSYDITIADVAIEFSTPSSAFANISNCLTQSTRDCRYYRLVSPIQRGSSFVPKAPNRFSLRL